MSGRSSRETGEENPVLEALVIKIVGLVEVWSDVRENGYSTTEEIEVDGGCYDRIRDYGHDVCVLCQCDHRWDKRVPDTRYLVV